MPHVSIITSVRMFDAASANGMTARSSIGRRRSSTSPAW
jgi:hypothetical protein